MQPAVNMPKKTASKAGLHATTGTPEAFLDYCKKTLSRDRQFIFLTNML